MAPTYWKTERGQATHKVLESAAGGEPRNTDRCGDIYRRPTFRSQGQTSKRDRWQNLLEAKQI